MNRSDYNALSAEDKKNVKFNDLPANTKFGLFFFAAVILGLGFYFFSGNTKKEYQLPNDVVAEQMAHNVVKAQFYDPDNVNFLPSNSKMATFKDSSFVFVGNVRAMDKSGLKQLVSYNVGIKWNGGAPMSDSSWIVKFCNIK